MFGLVDRAHPLDIAQDAGDLLNVACENPDRLRVSPAAFLDEPPGVGEVQQRHDGREAEAQRGVDDAPVAVQFHGGELTGHRFDPGPFQAEAERVQPRVGQQPHVVGVAVVTVHGCATGFHDALILQPPPVAVDVVSYVLVGGDRRTPTGKPASSR